MTATAAMLRKRGSSRTRLLGLTNPRQQVLRKTKKKVCQPCKANVAYVDYKDTTLLRKFISDRGKIRVALGAGATRPGLGVARCPQNEELDRQLGPIESVLSTIVICDSNENTDPRRTCLATDAGDPPGLPKERVSSCHIVVLAVSLRAPTFLTARS